MYDPKLGRWTSEDPIWPEDNVNPYVYVDNNPTNFTDPTGLILFAENQYSATSHLAWFKELGANSVKVTLAENRYVFTYSDRKQIEEIISRSNDQNVKDLLGAMIGGLEKNLTIYATWADHKDGKATGLGPYNSGQRRDWSHFYDETEVSQSEKNWLWQLVHDAKDEYRNMTGGIATSEWVDPGQYAIVTPPTRYAPQPPPPPSPEEEAEFRQVPVEKVLLEREGAKEWASMSSERQRMWIEAIKKDRAVEQWTWEAELAAYRKQLDNQYWAAVDGLSTGFQTVCIATSPGTSVIFAGVHATTGNPERAGGALVEGVISKGFQVAFDKLVGLSSKVFGRLSGSGAGAAERTLATGTSVAPRGAIDELGVVNQARTPIVKYRPLSSSAYEETQTLINEIRKHNGLPEATKHYHWPKQAPQHSTAHGLQFSKKLNDEQLARLSEFYQAEFRQVAYKDGTVYLQKGPSVGFHGVEGAGARVGTPLPPKSKLDVVDIAHTHPTASPTRHLTSPEDLQTALHFRNAQSRIVTRNRHGEVRSFPVVEKKMKVRKRRCVWRLIKHGIILKNVRQANFAAEAYCTRPCRLVVSCYGSTLSEYSKVGKF